MFQSYLFIWTYCFKTNIYIYNLKCTSIAGWYCVCLVEELSIYYTDVQNCMFRSRYKSTYDQYSGVTTLTILSLRDEDEGEYTCTAINPLGETSTSATLMAAGMWSQCLWYAFNQWTLVKLWSLLQHKMWHWLWRVTLTKVRYFCDLEFNLCVDIFYESCSFSRLHIYSFSDLWIAFCR